MLIWSMILRLHLMLPFMLNDDFQVVYGLDLIAKTDTPIQFLSSGRVVSLTTNILYEHL